MINGGNIARANALYRSGAYRDALALYEEIARQERGSWVQANINLCRKKLAAHPDHGGNGTVTTTTPEIVVTLTTIRSRLQYVPKVVESLLQQTLSPVRIELNISREPYLLDEGIEPDHPILLGLMKQPLLRVNWVPNIGPYRKIWPFLESYFSQDDENEHIFVTVDDDTLYPDYFLQELYKNYLQHQCVIAFRGRHIEMDEEKIAPYDRWTLGKTIPSLNNLPTGKDGILYSTKFFTKDFLDLAAVQRLAPTADDLWVKWHYALNGVPAVILNPEACTSDYKSFPLANYDKDYRNNSLYTLHNATSSNSKNDVSIKELEAHFKGARGNNLACLIRNPEVAYRISIQKFTRQRGNLPRLLFVEQSSETPRKLELDTVPWQAKSHYQYALANGVSPELDRDIALQNYGQGIAILDGVAFKPEVAEAVIAFMAELSEQNTLRYRLLLATCGEETNLLPRVEIWLPIRQDQSRVLDGRANNKSCTHLTSLKRLRDLLEKHRSENGGSGSLTSRKTWTNSLVTQGHELFKKKYLSNCHVLNLAHRTDRMAKVGKVFGAIDIQVNRVDAVFGKESSLCSRMMNEVTKRYESLASSEIPPFPVENEMYQNYATEEARNVHFAKKQGKLLSLGSLGYLLSYRKALVQGLCCATQGNDYITVFDDDVVLHSDWKNILETAFSQLPDNPAVIMLGAIQYHWGKGINWYSENLYCCNGTSIASHATVIHKDYAQFLVDEIEKLTLPFDIGPLHYLKSQLFGRSFVIYPNLLIQETSESDIADTKNQSIIGQTKDNVYRWDLDKYKVGLA